MDRLFLSVAGRCDLRPPMSSCSISTRTICASLVGTDLVEFRKTSIAMTDSYAARIGGIGGIGWG